MSELSSLAVASPFPAFDPLDRATLQEQAYQQLRGAVMSGVFKPGTIITIRAAADALGTSPMPIRAALQRLEVEGALIARGNKRRLAIPELTRERFEEIRDIRLQLEGYATEQAAARINNDELAEVEAAAQSMQDGAEAGDGAAYVLANWRFHLAIYRASRMPTLVAMIEALWLRIGPFVPLMMPERDSLVASMPAHWQAAAALKRGDGAAARAAIVGDIGDSADKLLKLLPKGDPAG
jgi:DNA-binding GntR family transcriptional regulator